MQGGGLRLNVGNTANGTAGGGTVTSSAGSQFKIASGATTEIGGDFTLDGSLDLASGSTMRGRGAFVINNTGILRGLGTVDVGSGTVQNDGTIAPGTLAVPTGTLNVIGNYTQRASGRLAMDLGGAGAGQFDVLAVSGTATLAGTLTAGLINEFQPGPGNQFAVIAAGTRVGDFGVKALPINFTSAPGATYVLSLAGNTCGASICFDNTGGDFLWSNPLNWTTDLLPVLTDTVLIDLAGNNTIVFNTGITGIHTIGSLSLSANNTLNLEAGSLTLSNDSTLAGALRISGGLLVIDAATVSVNRLVQSAGDLTINAGKTLRVTGQYDWTGGGTISGAGSLATLVGSTWNINDTIAGGAHTLSGVTVNNAGVVNYNVAGGNNRELLLNDGTVFNNLAGAVFDFKSDALVTTNAGNGGNFNNSGVVRKSDGTGNSGFAAQARFNNVNGSVDPGTGAMLLQSAGTHSGRFTALGTKVFFNAATHIFADGSVLNGTINFSGATINLGTTTVNDTLNLSAGRVSLNFKTTTIDGVFNWTGGSTLAGGTLVLTAATVTNINDTAGTNFHTLSAVTVNNAGVVNYNVTSGNTHELLVNDGSTFNNLTGAVFDFKSDALVTTENSEGAGTFNNSGVVRKSAGTGNSGFGGQVRFNNTFGTVNSGTGTLLLQTDGAHGGVFTVLGNNVLFNAANHRFADGSVLQGRINVTGASMNFGNATLNDTLNVSAGSFAVAAGKTVTVDGLFNWTAGTTLAGPGTLALSAANIWNINDSVGGGNHILSNLNVANRGRVTYKVTAGNGRDLLLSNGTALRNLSGANFDIQGDLNVFATAGCDFCRFDNTGLVLKSAGAGVGGLLGDGIAVTNGVNGVFRAASGSLQVTNFSVNDGTIDTARGSSFDLTTGALTNNGSLTGSGSINATAVINNGTIAPRFGAALTINGDLTLAPDSVLRFDLAGTARGTNFDAVNVNGALALGGTLQATLSNGFAPAQNARYQLLTATRTTGSFATTNLPSGFTGQASGTGFSLHFFRCAGSICFDNEAGDFQWSNALNWTGDVLPTLADDVVIDLGSALTVQAATGDLFAGSLLTASNVLLETTGGALSLQGGSVLNGGLSVRGGRFDSRGALTVAGDVALRDGLINFGGVTSLAGNLTVSGGELGGNGSIAVARNLNWSGGTLGGSGAITVASNGRLSISGADVKFLDGARRLINNSIAGSAWTGSGEVRASDGSPGLSSLINNAVFNIQTAAGWRDGNFVNHGTLTKSGPAGAQSFNARSGSFDNAGVFNIDAGDVTLLGNGDHRGLFNLGPAASLVLAAGSDAALPHAQRFASGARIKGGVVSFANGDIELAGSGDGLVIGPDTVLNLNGADVMGAGNLTVAAGAIVRLNDGSLGGSGSRTVDGRLQWTGGAVRGGQLITHGSSRLATGVAKQLANASWDNDGAVLIDDGNLRIEGTNAHFTNRGQLELRGGAGLLGNGRLLNARNARLTVNSPDVSHIGLGFDNEGSISIPVGVLQFDRNFTNNGNLDLGADNESGIRAGAIDVLANGKLGRVFGSGSIEVAQAGIAFTNAGLIAPGNSPGTITIKGDFVQTATGRLAVEIGGTRPGEDFDLLNISGRATLAGTIELDLLNNFLPQAGGSFDVVNSASLVGDFQSLILPNGQVLRGAALPAVYQISAAALLAGSTPPQDVINNVLVMPSIDIGRASGSVVVDGGIGEPLIEFVPRRRATCN